MANHNLPTLTSTYSNFVSELDGRLDDLALGLDPATTTATNVPTNAIRWSSSLNKWQKWNGSAWNDLSTSFAININGTVGATTPASGAFTTLSATGNVTLGDASTDLVTVNGRFNTDLLPSTDNARDLGTSANSWRNLWIDGTATIASVAIAGGTINNTVIGGTTRAAGNFTTLDANGNVVLGDATSDTITANGRFNTDVVPSTTNARDLGTTALRWRQVFATTFTEGVFPVVSQTDIGTAPNQVPLNQYLGAMAYMNPENVVIRPAASATPATIGGMVFELASNTSLVVKVRGSDGTVRSATLTLA
jgi:hypothetical protein